MSLPDAPSFHGPDHDHDHGPCLSDAVARAEAVFAKQGLRLTPLRRDVLAEVAGSHKAVGAYEVLEQLARKGGRRLAPISVYRALESLVSAGVVHRLESRNAFFACHASHHVGRRQIVLACTVCGAVAEVADAGVFDGITVAAHAAGFRMDLALVEVMGACRHCADTATADIAATAQP